MFRQTEQDRTLVSAMLTRMPAPVGGGQVWRADQLELVPARTIAETATDVGVLALCGLVWLVVIALAVLTLRAVMAEDLDREKD